MGDTYQPVYDAVRSRIGHVDSSMVLQVIREAFDLSYQKQQLQQEISVISYQLTRPSAVFKPDLYKDGDMWCALLGGDIAEGVTGFGASPEEAMAEFDKAWYKKEVPANAVDTSKESADG
jgi:hypothetical protein